MFIYEKFIKENIGKRKNKWIFESYFTKPRGKYVTYIIICKCDCGNIAHYPPSACLSPNFPQHCVMCARRKRKSEWWRERMLEDEVREFEKDREAESIVSNNYDAYYKKYYRD